MVKLCYTVQDPLGLHARPAGLLVKLAKGFPGTTITVTKGEQTVKATQLMMLMSICIKRGDEIEVEVHGQEEQNAAGAIQDFLHNHL